MSRVLYQEHPKPFHLQKTWFLGTKNKVFGWLSGCSWLVDFKPKKNSAPRSPSVSQTLQARPDPKSASAISGEEPKHFVKEMTFLFHLDGLVKMGWIFDGFVMDFLGFVRRFFVF